MNRQTALNILEIETEFPTKDEVRAAYIRQIKRNHPDCFFGTNPETQTIAENNTKLINEAREVLEEWVSFNNRSPISNSNLSRKENQRDDSHNNSNERDSEEQDNRKTQAEASHQPFKEKTSNPTNNSTDQRSEKKPPFSHDLFLASLIVFVVLAINSWVLLSFILSIATGTALFFSSASIVPATLIGLAGSLCFKYKSSTSKNRSAKKTRKVRKVNERAMRWLERVGNTIVLTVSVIFFGVIVCIVFIVTAFLLFEVTGIYVYDYIPQIIFICLAAGIASAAYLHWRQQKPERLEKPSIFRRAGAFLAGGISGFMAGGMALLIAGSILIILLRIVTAAFGVYISFLTPAGSETLTIIWFFLSLAIGLISGIYFAIHPDRI